MACSRRLGAVGDRGWSGCCRDCPRLPAFPGGGGFDGLEQVVAGGPQGQLGVGHGTAVVEVAAEPVGELGEDRLDGGGALLVVIVLSSKTVTNLSTTATATPNF